MFCYKTDIASILIGCARGRVDRTDFSNAENLGGMSPLFLGRLSDPVRSDLAAVDSLAEGPAE